MSDNNRSWPHSVPLNKIPGRKRVSIYDVWHLKAGRALPVMAAVAAFSANAVLAAAALPPITHDASVKHKVEKRAMQNLPAFSPISLEKFDAAVPPFTPEELWARIRALLMAYEGDITPADVERVFGIRLEKQHYSDGSGFYYIRKAPPGAWYDSIYVKYGSEFNDVVFGIDWNRGVFLDKYLSEEYIENSMNNEKWKLKSKIRIHHIQRDIYCYNSHNLFVDMNGDVVLGIRFGQILNANEKCIVRDQNGNSGGGL